MSYPGLREFVGFAKCVDVHEKDGRITVKCKLGLWSVDAPSNDEESVYLKAFHYWRQYAGDGEYSSIIGGPSVAGKMMHGKGDKAKR